MAVDRERAFKDAEKLIKQGKPTDAVAALKRLVEDASRDVTLHKQAGDLLTRHGLVEQAVDFYLHTAEHYGNGGFYPKAVAVYKIVLRNLPDNVDAMVRIGELYLSQRKSAEARPYLQRASDLYVESGANDRARALIERLVEAEPLLVEHRTRLAELLVAEGDPEGAAEELVRAAEDLGRSTPPERIEPIYRRATELRPDAIEPTTGLVGCLIARQELDAARAELDRHPAPSSGPDPLAVDRASVDAAGGEVDLAVRRLESADLSACPAGSIERFVDARLASEVADGLWPAVASGLSRWAANGGPRDGLSDLLDRLAALETPAYRPALEVWADVLRAHPDERDAKRFLAVVRDRIGDDAELRARAVGTAEPSPDPAVTLATGATAGESRARGAVDRHAEDETALEPTDVEALDVPEELEAPAVPLNRADEDFVSGRLTQAEIFEKYELADQALGQLQEVLERFPGHLEAQRRRVKLMREEGIRDGLGSAWFGVALAARADGKTDEARRAASQAVESGDLSEEEGTFLRGLGLARRDDAPAATASAAGDASDDDVIAIDLDDGQDVDFEAPATSPSTAEPTSKAGRDLSDEEVQEIRFYLDTGIPEEASRMLARLVDGGVAGPRADTARSDVAEAVGPVRDVETVVIEGDGGTPSTSDVPVDAAVSADAPEDGPSDEARAMFRELEDEFGDGDGPRPVSSASPETEIDEDDLAALTAQLDIHDHGPLPEGAESSGTPAPEEPADVDEVLQRFRQAVQEEVGSEDYRTHYDLGIGYKEMGLIDEAIAEFEIAAASADLLRDAAVMLGICCRELGRFDEAVTWYRKALADASADASGATDLRYELGETLFQAGDVPGALETFRTVREIDPGFRDVSERIDRIESSRTS